MKKMQQVKVEGVGLLMFDFFVKSVNQSVIYTHVRNGTTLAALRSADFKSTFPMYAQIASESLGQMCGKEGSRGQW